MARRVEPEIAERPPLASIAAPDVLPILLVDDRPENLHTLEAVLTPLGYPLATSPSGSEALRLLLERDFALILLDVRMPGLDGLETARLIKSRPRTRDVPIVFLTAARDEISDIVRGYGVGAVDYVLKPFDPELLRSKVAVFAELEASRRALKHSEAFLRGAFEAAPIGKTVLGGDRRIVRSNPAFARIVGQGPADLEGMPVADLCHPDDVDKLSTALDQVSDGDGATPASGEVSADLRLVTSTGGEVWVAMVATAIETTELEGQLLLAQWVDLTTRRRAEQARAELLLEQAARAQAERIADRLGKLQSLTGALQSVTLDELLPELVARLAEIFGADIAEVRITDDLDQAIVVRTDSGQPRTVGPDEPADDGSEWQEAPLVLEGTALGVVRLLLPQDRPFGYAERSLLRDAADRAALSIRRSQLHEEEHRIAVELQRGLIPKSLPRVPGIEMSAYYEVAGVRAEVGGDWYDAFPLSRGRLGVVLGDVAGRGIRAASAMVQLRSVTRAFALADDGRQPGEVLTRLNRYQLALDEEELVTVIYAIINAAEGTLSWSSAGHPPPLLRTSVGETRFLDGGDALMGIEDTAYHTMQQVIGQRDTLTLYTDGLVERRGESLDTGLERLASAVASGPQEPRPLCEHVLGRLLEPDRELHDDVTAVIVRLS